MEYEEAYKRQIDLLFNLTLDVIHRSRREPTSWQAECLVDAIAAMTMDSWAVAQDRIISCRQDDKPPRP